MTTENLDEIRFIYKVAGSARKYDDIVTRESPGNTGFDTWLWDCHIDRATASDQELAEAAVEFWNATLRPGDKRRKFVRMNDA